MMLRITPAMVANKPGHQGATVFLRKTCDRPASRLALRATAFGG
jgi:hypothetical protein